MPRGYHPIAQVDGVKPKRHFRHSPLLAGTTVEVDGHRRRTLHRATDVSLAV